MAGERSQGRVTGAERAQPAGWFSYLGAGERQVLLLRGLALLIVVALPFSPFDPRLVTHCRYNVREVLEPTWHRLDARGLQSLRAACPTRAPASCGAERPECRVAEPLLSPAA